MTVLALLALLQDAPDVPEPSRAADLPPLYGFAVGLEFDAFRAPLRERTLEGLRDIFPTTPIEYLTPGTETDDVEVRGGALMLRGAWCFYEVDHFALELYGRGGPAEFRVEGRVARPGGPSEAFDVDGTGDGFMGGIGLRGRLLRVGPVRLLSEFCFTGGSQDASIRRVDTLILDPNPGETADQDFSMTIGEVRLGIWVSALFDVEGVGIAPYAGFRWTRIDVEVDGTQVFDPGTGDQTTLRYQGVTSHFGATLGVELTVVRQLSVVMELRLGDQVGGTFAVGWRF